MHWGGRDRAGDENENYFHDDHVVVMVRMRRINVSWGAEACC